MGALLPDHRVFHTEHRLFLEKLESQPLSRRLRGKQETLLSDVGGPRLKREGWHIFYKRRTGRELLASIELE